MGFFHSLKDKWVEVSSSSGKTVNQEGVMHTDPPVWTPAPEHSYMYGKFNEAPEEECEAAEEFCREYPVHPPRLLPSTAVDTINDIGCRAWGLEHPNSPRFAGQISNNIGKSDSGVVSVRTSSKCKDVCLLSNLPIIAGLYDTKGKTGVYYEVRINQMDGFLAIGTACRPYPLWRLPGWNRLSAGLHLDDFRKFFEDPDGGRDYTDAITRISPGDTVGCGYEFANGHLFYTYNGIRLPFAFTGIYLPLQNQDVFAAVGVEGQCNFEVNFGGDLFRWTEGNEWAWRVEGHVGRMAGGPSDVDYELPSYQDIGTSRR